MLVHLYDMIDTILARRGGKPHELVADPYARATIKMRYAHSTPGGGYSYHTGERFYAQASTTPVLARPSLYY